MASSKFNFANFVSVQPFFIVETPKTKRTWFYGKRKDGMTVVPIKVCCQIAKTKKIFCMFSSG